MFIQTRQSCFDYFIVTWLSDWQIIVRKKITNLLELPKMKVYFLIEGNIYIYIVYIFFTVESNKI